MSQQVITALFDDYDSASKALSSLERLGLTQSDVSLVANNEGGLLGKGDATDGTHVTEETKADATSGAGAGASLGTVLGGGAGLLAGLGLLAIPGVGPVVAAGWLVATLTGAGVGAAAGGIAGSLTGAGIGHHDAEAYAEGVRRGGTLLTAKVDASLVEQVSGILLDNGAVDIDERTTSWKEQGWVPAESTTSVPGTRMDTGEVTRGGRVRVNPSLTGAAIDPDAVEVRRTDAGIADRARQA